VGNDSEDLCMGGDAKGIERGIEETGNLYHTYILYLYTIPIPPYFTDIHFTDIQCLCYTYTIPIRYLSHMSHTMGDIEHGRSSRVLMGIERGADETYTIHILYLYFTYIQCLCCTYRYLSHMSHKCHRNQGGRNRTVSSIYSIINHSASDGRVGIETS